MTARASSVLMLWGEDAFLLRAAAIEALGGGEWREVDAAEWRGGELADLATPSLFGERRALVISDMRSMPDEGMRELASYLAAPAPDAPLILLVSVGERGKAPAALLKLVEPVGAVREIKLARKDLPGWLVARSRAAGRELGPDAAAALVAVIGEDAGALDSAAAQLADAFPGQRLTREQVTAQFRGLGEQKVWDLCDKAFSHDLPGAIRALRSMLERGEAGLGILAVIAGRVRELIRVRSQPDRMSPADLAKAAGLRFEWQARRFRDMAMGYSLEELVRIHGLVVDADRALKSGADEDVVLPVLVTEIAGERVRTR